MELQNVLLGWVKFALMLYLNVQIVEQNTKLPDFAIW